MRHGNTIIGLMLALAVLLFLVSAAVEVLDEEVTYGETYALEASCQAGRLETGRDDRPRPSEDNECNAKEAERMTCEHSAVVGYINKYEGYTFSVKAIEVPSKHLESFKRDSDLPAWSVNVGPDPKCDARGRCKSLVNIGLSVSVSSECEILTIVEHHTNTYLYVRPYKIPAVPCPEDAKLCPDGSAVVRVGPDCQFEPCPLEKK